MNLLTELPSELHLFCDILEKSRKKFVKITLGNERNPKIWESKFGGMPYLPIGVDYPKDTHGKYMYLLAQINFEDMPLLDYMPNKGILQFYIADDVMYGLDMRNPTEQKGFKILYFHNFDKHYFRKDMPDLPEPQYSPLSNPLIPKKLHFALSDEYVSIRDITLHYLLGDRLKKFEQIMDNDTQIADWVFNNMNGWGTKIGGYASFTQGDPRYNEELFTKYDTLLLQITSSRGICWGDLGIGNFFINGEKLKKADFSDVMYNWDCG